MEPFLDSSVLLCCPWPIGKSPQYSLSSMGDAMHLNQSPSLLSTVPVVGLEHLHESIDTGL